jgi:DNA-binding transcriptional LysR family regulator
MQGSFSLDDLRLVRAIGEAGTLTGAARRLEVDHSTAFRRLGAVERRLGAHLFERARDGYTPTPAGEAALAAATRILEDLGDLERRLAGEDLRPSGIVRVTTTDTLLELISPILAGLRAEHPEITVELVVANSFFTLTKRDADIALRPAAAAAENLVGQRLAALATAPYAAPGYLARQPDRIALSAHAWIGFEESLSHLSSAKWVEANVARDRIAYRANSLLALRAAARAGMGVAALPCYLADPDSALRRVQAPLADMEVSLWLLTHPDLRRVARIRTVLDFLAHHFAKQRPLIERHKASNWEGFTG